MPGSAVAARSDVLHSEKSDELSLARCRAAPRHCSLRLDTTVAVEGRGNSRRARDGGASQILAELQAH